MNERLLGITIGPNFSADKGGGSGGTTGKDDEFRDYLPGGSEELPESACPDPENYTDKDLKAPAAGQRVIDRGKVYLSDVPNLN